MPKFPSKPTPNFHGHARFGDRLWTGALESVDVTATPERLQEGNWLIVATFEGTITAWRFAHTLVVDGVLDVGGRSADTWRGPQSGWWRSSMNRDEYMAAVESVRHRIREGDVYQANICRVLEAPLEGAEDGADAVPAPGAGTATSTGTGMRAGTAPAVHPGSREPSAHALWQRLAVGNPAPYAGFIHVPHGLTDKAGAPIEPTWVVTATPELYLSITDGRITSKPIKGTAVTAAEMLEKDRAENIMITDLVRNDLQRVSVPGSIRVDPLLEVQHHPGLVHLVSTVHGDLHSTNATGVPDWRAIFDATFPPGSVSGAPKESALQIISDLEPSVRGPYCGATGWIDGTTNSAELGVGIRTFWWQRDEHGRGFLRFGTGAGITWESDAAAEWEETKLKARRLVALASESDTPTGRSASASPHLRTGWETT